MSEIADKIERVFVRADDAVRARSATVDDGEQAVRRVQGDPLMMVMRGTSHALAKQIDTLDQYVVGLLEQIEALEKRLAKLEGRA